MFTLLKRQSGMTISELLVALLITGILTTAMFKVYINQHQAWNQQESLINTQQNTRSAIDELTRQLRMTGYGVPNGLIPFDAHNGNPDSICFRYLGYECEATLSTAMSYGTSPLECAGSDVSCFNPGQKVYIYDPVIEQGEFFTISTVDAGASQIAHGSALTKNYPAGAIVSAISDISFFVDRSDSLHPCLMVAVGNFPAQVYAENIIDFQLKYVLKNGMTVDNPTIARDVRQIDITVVGRTDQPNPQYPSHPYSFRTYKSQVYLRNIG